MTTVVETTQMPSLAPPDDGLAHLTRSGKVALCGSNRAGHGGHISHHTRCSCGVPICPACRQIWDTWNRTGCKEDV